MLLAADIVAHNGGRSGGPSLIVPLLLLLLGGFLLFRVLRRRSHHLAGVPGMSPFGTLQDRFARGEIDRQEYEYRLAVLRGKGDVPTAPASMAPPAPPTPRWPRRGGPPSQVADPGPVDPSRSTPESPDRPTTTTDGPTDDLG